MDRSVPAWRQALSRDDIGALLEMRDWKSWRSIAVNWGLVFASFALVAVWPNPLSIVLALFVIGARQLGLAVIMHDASHRAFFRSRALNDFTGNWLAAYPIWSDLRPYRPYHLQHHAKTGRPEIPTSDLVTPFPVTRASMRRKIWRDLSGQTGVEAREVVPERDLGRLTYSSSAATRWRDLRGVVLITNLVLLAIPTAFGHPELYLLWVGAWFTTHTSSTRMRSIAEHAHDSRR